MLCSPIALRLAGSEAGRSAGDGRLKQVKMLCGAKMKILVTDDDPVSRLRTCDILEREGYEVYEAEDGRSATELLISTAGPRLAVLDLTLPGLDGPTVCRSVRSQYGRAYVYVIFVVPKESKAAAVRHSRTGADDYITRPFDLNELTARLRIGRRVLELEDRLLHESRHDSLTHLPNRKAFLERVEACVKRARRQKDYNFAVLFLDIDRFKSINASLGHAAGDEVILQLSRRLAGSIRLADPDGRKSNTYDQPGREPGDLLARLAGDEFAILLDGICDTSDAVRVAERIQRRLKSPFTIAQQMLPTSVSIGIAASSTSYGSAQDVMRDADTAMYRAKSQGYSKYEICDPVMQGRVIARLRLENDLRGAVDRKEFVLSYQPIFSLLDGHISGFEALIRWQRSAREIVTPTEFISIAEETGLVVPIGHWVLREACRQIRAWRERFPQQRRLTVAVNVSAKQLAHPDFVDQVAGVLRESCVPPTSLKLELTETLAMRDTEQTAAVLSKLMSLGVGMSIDDFGTGYSSFAYLRRFRFDTLKLDRTFVSEIESSPQDLKIAQAIVSVGRSLEMDVVAEGVETAGQAKVLRSIGCQYAQGYYFAKPMGSREAECLLDLQGTALAPSCGLIGEWTS